MRPVTHAELHAELADVRGPLARLEARVTRVEGVLTQLDERVTGVENRLTQLEERVKSIETHGATKTDLAALEIRLLDRIDKSLEWTIGAALAVVSVVVAGIGVILTALPRMIGS